MIHAQDLTRRFGTITAVEKISLELPAGSVLALLGPNGAGKTTTVRMLAGLLAPTEGKATILGYDVLTEARAVRTSIGLMTDVPGLYEQMTAEKYLHFFGKLYGMSQSQRALRINELLGLFELNSQQKKMEGFSKGMKQKVALARALLHDPAVLFLDEPTSGLDPLAARTVRELILSLKHASRSIILCTHDLDEAERLADQVAIMRQGKIVAYDTPEKLRARAMGETEVRIELARPFPQTLAVLQAIPDINAPTYVEKAGKDAGTPALLTYRTMRPEEANPHILATLMQEGAQLVKVSFETTSLEDVYASVMDETSQTSEVINQSELVAEKAVKR